MAASWFIKNQFFQKFKIGHKNPLHDAKIHPSAEILTGIDSQWLSTVLETKLNLQLLILESPQVVDF